ncbi:MAG: hypothetical protein HY861_02915 [Chlamydiia bacterium]|nr:hypothetical protein [Chlamydiia bacterium]
MVQRVQNRLAEQPALEYELIIRGQGYECLCRTVHGFLGSSLVTIPLAVGNVVSSLGLVSIGASIAFMMGKWALQGERGPAEEILINKDPISAYVLGGVLAGLAANAIRQRVL